MKKSFFLFILGSVFFLFGQNAWAQVNLAQGKNVTANVAPASGHAWNLITDGNRNAYAESSQASAAPIIDLGSSQFFNWITVYLPNTQYSKPSFNFSITLCDTLNGSYQPPTGAAWLGDPPRWWNMYSSSNASLNMIDLDLGKSGHFSQHARYIKINSGGLWIVNMSGAAQSIKPQFGDVQVFMK